MPSNPPPGPLDPSAARVDFAPGCMARVERFAPRLSAELARREGPGGAFLQGRGLDWIGFRPYRSGDDAMGIDPSLLARLGKPFVRQTRREAASRWLIAFDCSGSMAVGRPSKLQTAAECALALSALGLAAGAQVRLLTSGSSSQGPDSVRLDRRAELVSAFKFLQRVEARGKDAEDLELGSLAGVGRLFWIGDPCSHSPRLLDRLVARGREVFALHLAAPVELDPPRTGAVLWRSPESGATRQVSIDAGLRAGYIERLEALLDAWRRHAHARLARYAAGSSAEPFESLLGRLLGLPSSSGLARSEGRGRP